jgi:hypothetical protein
MPNYAFAIDHSWGELHLAATFLTGNAKAIQLSPTHSRIGIDRFMTALLATPCCKYLGFYSPSDFQFYPGMIKTILIPRVVSTLMIKIQRHMHHPEHNCVLYLSLSGGEGTYCCMLLVELPPRSS